MKKLSTLKYYYKSIYNASDYIYYSHGNMKVVPIDDLFQWATP